MTEENPLTTRTVPGYPHSRRHWVFFVDSEPSSLPIRPLSHRRTGEGRKEGDIRVHASGYESDGTGVVVSSRPQNDSLRWELLPCVPSFPHPSTGGTLKTKICNDASHLSSTVRSRGSEWAVQVTRTSDRTLNFLTGTTQGHPSFCTTFPVSETSFSF